MENLELKSQTENEEEQTCTRVLRTRPSVHEAPPPENKKERPWYPLVLSEMKLRLELPGIFSLDIDVPPAQDKKSYVELYNNFEGRYWKRIMKKRPTSHHRWDFECLLCSTRYSARRHLIGHLNRHIGFYIARCQKCPGKFFSLSSARNHQKICLKNHPEPPAEH